MRLLMPTPPRRSFRPSDARRKRGDRNGAIGTSGHEGPFPQRSTEYPELGPSPSLRLLTGAMRAGPVVGPEAEHPAVEPRWSARPPVLLNTEVPAVRPAPSWSVICMVDVSSTRRRQNAPHNVKSEPTGREIAA